MRFPIPSTGVNPCALSWRPPPEFSARAKDVTTKGDVTEIEVWQLIAPSATSATVSSSLDELDYDDLSYSTLPVRGELLGVLDLTAKPNSTKLEFACPSEAEKFDGGDEVPVRGVSCELHANRHGAEVWV